MRSTAFTLIELLIVIAIISTLVALLFPVFAAARERTPNNLPKQHATVLLAGNRETRCEKAYTNIVAGQIICLFSSPNKEAMDDYQKQHGLIPKQFCGELMAVKKLTVRIVGACVNSSRKEEVL